MDWISSWIGWMDFLMDPWIYLSLSTYIWKTLSHKHTSFRAREEAKDNKDDIEIQKDNAIMY